MGSKNWILLCLVALWSGTLTGQDWSVESLEKLNTGFNEFPAFMLNEALIYYSDREKDLLHSEDWKLKSEFQLFSAQLETNFVELPKGQKWMLAQNGETISNTMCRFPSGPNWLIFSKTGKGTELFKADTVLGKFRILESMGAVADQIIHASPTDSENGFMISFLRVDGNHGLEIGLLQLGKNKASILPISSVNTDFNEVFPVWNSGDLYFSSDRDGGLDLYFASREEQWETVHKLPEPLNSPEDDFAMVFLNDERGFFASSRKGGKGQDDIYLFQHSAPKFIEGYSGRLSVRDRGLKAITLNIYNDLGELISQSETDIDGRFALPGMEDGSNYRIVPQGDARVLKASVLELMDPRGTVTQRVLANADGHFLFEFLPYLNPGGLTKVDNPDQSSLFGIRISGQVKTENDGADDGSMVILMDRDGATRQITYTGDSGEFEFSEVSPKSSYQLGLDSDDPSAQIQIEGAVEALPKSSDGNYVYQRLEEGSYKTLILGSAENLEIRSGEALNLNRIDYEFDAWQLDANARVILKELATLMKLNPDVKIELHSHTDSRGTDSYNLELSQKRAGAAIDYLRGLGVASVKLVGRGLGESELLNECGNGVDCTDEKHAENRRTEVILRME